ncbi:putative lipoprotein LpqJ [Mycolicibacterium aurum]|uniref:Putative lipoprotein LpqJ n=2 Tax=Mycolicibacterium aurum TaxID=1791 RepID=A0A3S4RSL3_MYCAU|nr:putative lipoprotein LpqJ [Mycolicibacterium aurum]
MLRTLDEMKARVAVAELVLAAAALAGCQSSVDGTATREPDSYLEPNVPTPRPSQPSPAPSSTPAPAPSPSNPRPSGGEELAPQNGYVFIQTKSGKTRCQLDEQEVGCEAAFTNAPEINGAPANGVRLTADGDLSWVQGNLGAIPAVTLDYRTYSAVGWSIDADENGTRFTNDSTGRGMVISVEGVETF